MGLSERQYVSDSMKLRCLLASDNCGKIAGPLGVEAVDGAIVLPMREGQGRYTAGMTRADGTPIQSSSLHELLRIEDYMMRDQEEIVDDAREVIYMGLMLSQWGHALTDNLKRLWFLSSPEGVKLLERGVSIVYIADSRFSLTSEVAKVIKLAGVDISGWERVEKPTRFRRVWNPDLSLMEHKYGRLWSQEQAEIYERILANTPMCPSPYTHVYFSRTHLKSQPKMREQGEAAIERAFKREGYHIAYPEEMSLEEQINMLRGCKAFAATECSTSHNSVWCPADAHVIILQKAHYFNPWQTAINNIRGYRVTYVNTAHSSRIGDNNCGGPFYMCVTHHLERFFGHRIPHWPRYLRLSWWRYLRMPRGGDYEGIGFAIPRLGAAVLERALTTNHY